MIATIKIIPKVIYSPGYDIHFLGLEKLHPFDSCKYSRTWNALLEQFGDSLQHLSIIPTTPTTEEILLSVHTETYLNQLKNSRFIARALELDSLGILPARILAARVLKPMRLATMGTVIAAQTALETGIAINLSGGYHHASSDRGQGFCIYADIAVAIALLRQRERISHDDSVAIIDLDAHQGNGLERIFYDDPAVQILDMYNQDIYPNERLAQQRINYNLPLKSGTGDQEYLGILEESLPKFLAQINQPKIAFYNAGTDIYEHDPLGRLKISKQGILSRDRLVFQTLIKAGIPTVMVLSGGYTRESYKLVADSVADLLLTYK